MPTEAAEMAAPFELSVHRRLARDACWQLDVAEARALLQRSDQSDPAAPPEWRHDQLDRALAAVRVRDVNEEAIRLFGLTGDRERLMARPIAILGRPVAGAGQRRAARGRDPRDRRAGSAGQRRHDRLARR
jgi:hypothetical protein